MKFDVGPENLKAAAQTMLQCNSNARSIESAVAAMLPLTKDDELSKRLTKIRRQSREVSRDLMSIYEAIAPEAFHDHVAEQYVPKD